MSNYVNYFCQTGVGDLERSDTTPVISGRDVGGRPGPMDEPHLWGGVDVGLKQDSASRCMSVVPRGPRSASESISTHDPRPTTPRDKSSVGWSPCHVCPLGGSGLRPGVCPPPSQEHRRTKPDRHVPPPRRVSNDPLLEGRRSSFQERDRRRRDPRMDGGDVGTPWSVGETSVATDAQWSRT